MNILFLTQVLPYPLNAGPKARAYYVLRHLAESGHDIQLVSFTREDDRPEYTDHLRQYCREIHGVPIRRSRLRDGRMLLQALVSGQPFLVARDRIPGMARVLRSVVSGSQSFDAIHADQLWMAPYALFARDCAGERQQKPLTVLDQHNAVFNIPGRLAESEGNFLRRRLLVQESKKLARYERKICGQFDRVVWVTHEDRQALFANGENPAGFPAGSPVIPIALDISAREPFTDHTEKHRVTFMGGLHWPPNMQGMHWFRNEVWPQVKNRIPGAVLTIIGRDSERARGNGGDSSIEAAGYVADPKTYLSETAVFIVPLFAGGGMRVKILDAWSWGLPVVSTSIGAEGIQTDQRENLYLADDPDSFASAVVEVLSDPQTASTLARGGRRTAEELYDWRKTYRAWDQIYPCESST